MMRAVLLAALLALAGCSPQHSPSEGHVLWIYGMLVPYGGLSVAEARAVEPGLSAAAFDIWLVYRDIYGLEVPEPTIRLILHAGEGTMPSGHPVVGWAYGTDRLDLNAHPSMGTPQRWLCGELHNVFRWRAHLSQDPKPGADQQRFDAATAAWRGVN